MCRQVFELASSDVVMCIFLYFRCIEDISRTALNVYSMADVDAMERLRFVVFIP